ncbi:uncharacterized protein TNCV_1502231 [Trichonephila clavipes]|uniref:Uncharacterized protein n=1 Tax=Trichonephila clavipes TaxID=2585209 RepID=A0A8X6RQF4_TRICX|nr:uncharacterized protein TNCV_1502231 [Trichonephila clavipes]
MEMKTQQGGPFRARKSKGRNYNPYIEEQTRSGNKNTRRRSNQQQRDKEMKGGENTSRTISLEVVVEDANYKWLRWEAKGNDSDGRGSGKRVIRTQEKRLRTQERQTHNGRVATTLK